MAFTCENKRYRTDESKGHPHGPGQPRGSVFREPLSGKVGQGATLWLEHIVELAKPGWEGFWLMWYRKNGQPTLVESAVFDVADLKNIVGWLSDISKVL
ncbi:MAG: hypothetical protein ACRYG8_44825 [Janthinobacterium lividum]